MTFPAEMYGVCHSYSGNKFALDDIDLRLEDGVTALVGVNGAGKSTLLSVLSGALRPSAGQVMVCGSDVYGSARRRALPRIALMPQTMTMPGIMTALEVVSVIGWMRGLKDHEVRHRSVAALEAVDLGDRSNDRVRELSGGMKRRLALAQALVTKPDVLVLDEPSTGLDPQQRRRMIEVVQSLQGTVLFSSHVMEDVVDTADRVVLLHEARIVFNGSIAELEQLAPIDGDSSRAAEAAFLRVITTQTTSRP